MNNKLLILFLLLCVSYLSAQDIRTAPTEIYQGEQFLLDTSFNSRINYEFYANDSIILEPSFSRQTWFHGENCTMDLTVNGFGVYPPSQGAQGGPLEGDNGYVGALGGSLDVGVMGGASYTIPIELPEGINGMTPELAITYNSQGGNGLLGYKWDLAGLSSITRTGKTLYHDGEMGGVTLNDVSDRFMLDGLRLIPVASWDDSTEYKTEQDGFAKIMAYMNKKTIIIFGHTLVYKYIRNFKVWKPNGLVLEYGYTSNSRIDPQNPRDEAVCWLLNKVSDRNGNAILYNYTELTDTGEFYISSIEYTQNDSLRIKPEFLVKFGYESRTDREFGYIQGNLVAKKRLLKSIDIFNMQGFSLQKYEFQYQKATDVAMEDYRHNRAYSRLVKVFMEKDGMPINPTTIRWEWDENLDYQRRAFQQQVVDTTHFNKFLFVGDFNADGFSDVLTVPYKNGSQYPGPIDMNVLLNTGHGAFISSHDLSMNQANGQPVVATLDWVHVLDINDDGYDDIILQYNDPESWYPHNVSSLMLYLNRDGQRWTQAWDSPVQIPLFKFYLAIGDFLGEGKQSAVAFLYQQFDTIPIMGPLLYIHYDEGTCLRDTITNSGFTVVNEFAIGDFNGDGHSEILMVDQNQGHICGLKRTNDGFQFDLEVDFTGIRYVPELNLFPGDFNGDGKTDLLCYGQKNNEGDLGWFFLFSKGNDFQQKSTKAFEDFAFAPNSKLYSYSLEKVNQNSGFSLSVADFDGDGLSDVALSNNQKHFFQIFSKFAEVKIHLQNGWWSMDSFNPMARAASYDLNASSQYLHVGNFYGKDNLSFFGNEIINHNTLGKKPMLFSLYSLNEYSSATAITDGMGNSLRLDYQYLPVVGVNQIDLGHGLVSKNIPLRAVKSHTSYAVNEVALTSTYAYTAPLFHKKGHGYLGFTSQSVIYSEGGQDVSYKKTSFETATMGDYGFSLPSAEETYVFINGDWRLSEQHSFVFHNVTSTRDSLIVNPAMLRKISRYYDFDSYQLQPPLLRKELTQYDYDCAGGYKYFNTYHCEQASFGTDSQDVDNINQCEFRRSDVMRYYEENYPLWIVNRMKDKIQVMSRTGKPNVDHGWKYEYYPSSYQIMRTYDKPNPSDPHDPLMLRTDFEYHPDGNLKKKTVRTPYAQHGEPMKTFEYEYGPGEGSENRHRLVTKETVGSGNLSYQTSYSYDIHDNVDTLVGSNGLVTAYWNDALGNVAKSYHADGTQSCTALRWADGYQYAPQDALYFKWSRSSGTEKTLVFYHKTGAELRSVSFGLQGEAIFVDKNYDKRGRLYEVSNPYKEGETPQWTTYGYDNLDRLVSTITPDTTETAIAYQGNRTTTTIIPTVGLRHQSTVTVNAMGWTIRSDDASQNSHVTYDHFADGLMAAAMVNDDTTTMVAATYDDARNRFTLADPNYGILTTIHDAYGQLKRRISPKELAAQGGTFYYYDGMGRLVRETDSLENTTTHYVYNEDSCTLKGTLKEIHHRTLEGQAIQYLYYDYDSLARLVKTRDHRPSVNYVTQVGYDEFSRISQTTYPTGVSIRRKYAHGRLQSIVDAHGKVLWRTDAANAFGQLTDATLGNGVATHRAYDPVMHYLDSIVTSNNLQNLSYTYDKFGNLASRKDNFRNLEETFGYDKMDRLTYICLGSTYSRIRYDALGRMTMKQADGQAVFANAAFAAAAGQPARPHAMKSAEAGEGVFPTASQTVAYTGFDKVKAIAEGGNTLEYTYGYDKQRIRVVDTVDGVARRKDYADLCEFVAVTDSLGSSAFSRTFIVGPYGVFAVVERQGDEETVHYILKDHLGSWTTITDSEGNVEQELSFDAWGNLRDPDTWQNYSMAEPSVPELVEGPMFDRGYTGHEHMTAFGLINMNGRCYDPLTSSFLSVDAYVQDPTSAQAFNRYAYCGYNPLRYTDPTGWHYGPPGTNNAPNINPVGHTQWYSSDPNDVLLGRSVHPCRNSSSGYINGTAVTSTGYTEGNYGLHGSNYTVDAKGYVKNMGSNDMTYDVLYTSEDYASGDYSNCLVVYDLSILAGFTEDREDYWDWIGNFTTRSGHYSSTQDIDEAFKVYFFMTQNTNVEWAINGFRLDRANEYVIATMHNESSVTHITKMSQYSVYNQIFSIHNHNSIGGTKGGSWVDVDNIRIIHRNEFNSKDINRWFVHNGQSTIFPKHYVYHNQSSVLYYYLPDGRSDIYIRKINTYKDLYRNLGF